MALHVNVIYNGSPGQGEIQWMSRVKYNGMDIQVKMKCNACPGQAEIQCMSRSRMLRSV